MMSAKLFVTLDIESFAEHGAPGLTEDELNLSIATLSRMSSALDADYNLLRSRKTETGLICDYLIRLNQCDAKDFQEIRVAVVGNVDAGKSTLLGVLTHGELDNGRGLARQVSRSTSGSSYII